MIKFNMIYIYIQDIFRNFVNLINSPLESNELLKSPNLLIYDSKIRLIYNLSVILCMVYLLFVLIFAVTCIEESNSELLSLSLLALNNLNKSKGNPEKNKKTKLRDLLKQQLYIFYKSRTIFSGFIIKNKYVILYLVFLTLITFIFNKNVNSFKGLNFYEINHLTIILYFVILYSIYIKFSIILRIFSLIKSFKFFYVNLSLNLIKDIKIIALYYYIFNSFFIIISIFFIANLSYNLNQINLQNYIDITNILSLVPLLCYVDVIFKTEIKITENNNFKSFPIIVTLLLIFIPFFIFNCYPEKISLFFERFFVIRPIYCDTVGDPNLLNNLKDENSSKITLKNENINPDHNIVIRDLKQINKKFFEHLVKEIKVNKIDNIETQYNNFINHSTKKYIIDKNLLTFLNENLTTITNNNINPKNLNEFVNKLYNIDLEHKSTILLTMDEHKYRQQHFLNHKTNIHNKGSLIDALKIKLNEEKNIDLKLIEESKNTKTLTLVREFETKNNNTLLTVFGKLKKKASFNSELFNK